MEGAGGAEAEGVARGERMGEWVFEFEEAEGGRSWRHGGVEGRGEWVFEFEEVEGGRSWGHGGVEGRGVGRVDVVVVSWTGLAAGSGVI